MDGGEKSPMRQELIYMGWLVGWIIGKRVYLTEDAPSFYEDEWFGKGYSIVRV